MARKRQPETVTKREAPVGIGANLMRCPGCRVVVPKPVEACPECGYSGGHAVKKFPFEAPELKRFIDPDRHLAAGICREIDEGLERLAESFPQPRFCFCIVDLARETDPREFGFWLMNASPVRDAMEERWRPWTILLLIDHSHCRASVTTGYALENFLNEESWKSLLQLEARSFLEADYGTAILRFVSGATAVLSDASARIRQSRPVGRKTKRGEERW